MRNLLKTGVPRENQHLTTIKLQSSYLPQASLESVSGEHEQVIVGGNVEFSFLPLFLPYCS